MPWRHHYISSVKVTYTGKASHAAAAPWDGVNALDAVVMAYSSISCMRQQLKPSWRIHGGWEQSLGWKVEMGIIHKSHYAPVPYRTMYHPQQKWAHPEWCIVRYGTGALWDLWDWSIADDSIQWNFNKFFKNPFDNGDFSGEMNCSVTGLVFVCQHICVLVATFGASLTNMDYL